MYKQITSYGFTCDVPYCTATTGPVGADANEAQTAALLAGWDISEVMSSTHLCPEHVALKPSAPAPAAAPAPSALAPADPLADVDLAGDAD